MIRIFHNTRFEFVKHWRLAAGLTVAFIVVGLVTFGITGGVKYSIEFTGGTLMQVQFKEAPDVAVIRSTLDKAGIGGTEIQQYGSATEYTIRARDEKQVEAQAAGAEGISKEIGAALEQQFDNPSAGTNRLLQVSKGFTYTWDNAKAKGDKVSEIKLNGQAIDPAASYRVVLNNFLADGGDGFTTFAQGTNRLGGDLDIDAFRAFLTSGTVTPDTTERIKRLN